MACHTVVSETKHRKNRILRWNRTSYFHIGPHTEITHEAVHIVSYIYKVKSRGKWCISLCLVAADRQKRNGARDLTLYDHDTIWTASWVISVCGPIWKYDAPGFFLHIFIFKFFINLIFAEKIYFSCQAVLVFQATQMWKISINKSISSLYSYSVGFKAIWKYENMKIWFIFSYLFYENSHMKEYDAPGSPPYVGRSHIGIISDIS